MKEIVYRGEGYCPICEAETTFEAKNAWFRDHLLCMRCGSIPRERALMAVLAERYPHFRHLAIHESSPGDRGVSAKLQSEVKNYSSSQFFPDIEQGDVNQSSGVRCENLECLTFEDEAFDLFLTQDVIEHIFAPEKAFSEIARVLKPGGAHIFTAPLVNKNRKSERRAERTPDGDIAHLFEPEYHGNPIDPEGSLVTMNWGYDIVSVIHEHSGLSSVIIQIDDMERGIRAEFIDVVASFKTQAGAKA